LPVCASRINESGKNIGMSTANARLNRIVTRLTEELQPLRFAAPVSHVYNPLEYAGEPYRLYLKTYAPNRPEAVFVGMNPGPWGMAQTGIPFGEIGMVRDWLNIQAPVGRPRNVHPRRPVTGFNCTRSEVSGRRLWGWVRERFKTPRQFFERFFVANYCPLMFLEASGRNRTPNRLKAAEKKPLLAACDRALQDTIAILKPQFVIGIGRFAAERVCSALSEPEIITGGITHPSPANPKANRDWASLITRELRQLGIRI
jgi:single-strand selective monofunctional uracil DNA glycosylase